MASHRKSWKILQSFVSMDWLSRDLFYRKTLIFMGNLCFSSLDFPVTNPLILWCLTMLFTPFLRTWKKIEKSLQRPRATQTPSKTHIKHQQNEFSQDTRCSRKLWPVPAHSGPTLPVPLRPDVVLSCGTRPLWTPSTRVAKVILEPHGDHGDHGEHGNFCGMQIW